MDIENLPDDLSTLSDDELTEAINALVAEFDRLHDEGSTDLPALTQLAERVQACRAEEARRAEENAAAEVEVARLNDLIHPQGSDTPDDAPEPGEGEGEGEGEPGGDAPEDATPTPEATPERTPEPVTAAGARRPSAGQIARRGQRPQGVRTPRVEVVITAAADVPGFATSARMSTLDVASAFHDRARGLNDGSPPVNVCRIAIPGQRELSIDPEANIAILDEVCAADSAAALVASGGWCVPSQPLLDLFEIGDAADLIDLPSVTVRGGMLIPSFFTWTDAAGALWNWTEANDIDAAAGTPTKPCLVIPCPTWTDCRLEAEGLCVTHGNLSDRAYPQLTRSFVNTVMNAHLHRLSAAKIAKIAAGATAVAFAGENSDAAGDLISALELQAADLRSQYRASDARVVEAVLPTWVRPALRANVAKRAGVDLLSVSDAQITGWLTNHNIRPQFVSDYQPLFNATPATDWPGTLEFLMYFAGAYVEGNGGNIDLGVVRDSVLNATNDFTAAWSEQFFQVCRRGPAARKVTVDLDIDGVTACCEAAAPAP